MSKKRQPAQSVVVEDSAKITLNTQSIEILKSVAYNVRQEMLLITRDKVELCLTKHMKAMEQRQAWIVPSGFFLAAITALVTSTFHSWIGITGTMWQSMFILCTAFTGLWAIIAFFRRGKSKSIKDVIDELMGLGTIESIETDASLTQATSDSTETAQLILPQPEK